MLRPMHETADDGRRQLRSSYTPEVAECINRDVSKLCHRCVDLRGKCFQHGVDVASEKILGFRSHRGELLGRQDLATRVGEEAIDNAPDMSYVKSRRGNTTGAGVPFGLR